MPLYCYKCKDCHHEFEVRHSMSFSGQLCTKCNSESVFRVPSLSEVKNKTPSTKPGKIVSSYIQDTKKEIAKEKKNLRNREL